MALAAAGGALLGDDPLKEAAVSPEPRKSHALDQLSEANDDEEDDAADDELRPLRVGDFITLRNIPNAPELKRGFLSAEGILEDACRVSDKPAHFDESVFQICIQFQYSALKEYQENIEFLEELQAVEAEEEASRLEPDAGSAGEGEAPREESDAQKLSKLVDSLQRSMENEKRLNDTYMQQSIGNPIKFGSTIQLLHVKSRKYITVDPNEVASHERENLSVRLSESGSSLSWFTLLPCYKIDREGDFVNSGASLILRVSERTSEQIHCCQTFFESDRRKDGDRRREVNCSLEPTGWRVILYSPYHDEADKSFFAGDMVRLIDPERNAALRLVDRETAVLSEIVEDFNGKLDSASLWVVEGYTRPAIGGAITYGPSRSFRLRHANSGKYLCLKSSNLWSKSARLLRAARAAAGTALVGDKDQTPPASAPTSVHGDAPRKETFYFGGDDLGVSQACALTFNTPYGALKSKGGINNRVEEITNGAPVQIACQSRWMHAGEVQEGDADEDLATAAVGKGSRPGSLSLIFDRYVPPADNLDILVGTAAYPRLTAFREALDHCGKPGGPNARAIASMEPAFAETIDQLACFFMGKDLFDDPLYEDIKPSELRDLRESRQLLIAEQGVLDVLIVILKRLDSLVEDAVAKASGGRRTSSVQRDVMRRASTVGGPGDHGPPAPRSTAAARPRLRTAASRTQMSEESTDSWEAIQGNVGNRIFWLLLLATRDALPIQMQVADHIQVFISYVPNEPIATACLVHMLNTNLPLQETKVSEEETGYIVQMVSESRMESLYLELLRALCSCSGSGVDCNQCRVVDFWMEGGKHLHCRLLQKGSSKQAGNWTLGSETGFKKPNPDLVRCIEGHELLSSPLPALYLAWDTDHDDLKPRALAGFAGTPEVPIQAIYRSEVVNGEDGIAHANRQTIASYLVSQLFLAAELCLDRNYLSIGLVTEQFPFAHCLAMIQDAELPNELKAAVVRIISTAYVDKDPSVKQCCPHLAHTWSDLSDSTASDAALGPQDRVRFLLLQDILDQYLNNPDNIYDGLKQRMMELLLKLVQFSFYSTTEDMQRLVQPLLSDLSRREDAESAKVDTKNNAKAVKAAALAERAKAKRGGAAKTTGAAKKYKASSVSPEDDDLNLVAEGSVHDDGKPRPSCLYRLICCPCWCCRKFCNLFGYRARPDSWQSRWYDKLDSVKAMGVVLAMVAFLLVCFAMGVEDINVMGWWSQEARNAQRAGGPDPVVSIMSVASTFCTVALIVEVSLRWYCYAVKNGRFWYFLRDPHSFPFNIIDFFLMLSDIMSLTGVAIKFVEIEKEVEETLDWNIPHRYRFTPLQQIQTMLEIVTVLGEVSLVHRECNLTSLLAFFKNSYTGTVSADAVSLYHRVVDAAPRLSTLAQDTLFASVETNGGDTAGDRDVVASRRFDEIFLDLCLYEHDGLVQSALNLLMVQHSVRDALVRDVAATQLLSDPADEMQCKRLKEVLMELQSNAERHELWGDIEDEEEKQTNEKVKNALREITSACMMRREIPGHRCPYEPVESTQTLLFNLGALDVAMTVIDLEGSMTDGMDAAVMANTKDIIRLCMVFLQWFVRDHKHNQLAAYEYLERFVDCFDHDVQSPSVIAEVVRGNVELTKNFPLRIVTECANQIIKNGRNYCYLDLFEALLFLEEGAVENNVELQFAVLRELSRPSRDEPMMWLCQEAGSEDYLQRADLMAESLDIAAEATQKRSLPRNMTPAMDEEYLPPLLRYNIKLLEVLAGCALGSIDITTVEAKLQNLYPPIQLLQAILDKRTTLNARYALSMFLYHTTIEVEINVPAFERNSLFMRVFMERYVPGPSSWREVEMDPVLVEAMGGGKQSLLSHSTHSSSHRRNQRGSVDQQQESSAHLLEDDLLPSWLDTIVEQTFKTLTALYDIDEDVMPRDHRLVFHDTLVRLSMSLHGSQYHVAPLLDKQSIISEDTPGPHDIMTPAATFNHLVADLQDSEDIDTSEDVVRIVNTFNSLPHLADIKDTPSAPPVEPLIMKLVSHTLGRLKPSARGKKLDPDCTRTARWLVKIFRAMIEKACGVTKLCLLLIAPGIDRELSLEGIKLCIALLFREGGNTAVQATINEVLKQDCEQFFKAVREYMLEIKNYYSTATRRSSRSGGGRRDPGTCMVMRFLQLMSEGHFEPNQDIMREQPLTNINLLDDFVELLSILSRDKHRCRSSTKAALQAASTLLEVIQGPCKKNQMHLAIHTELIEILNRITRSKPIRDCLVEEDNETKKTALEIYEGLLEGETGNSVIITRIISVIDLEVLKDIIEERDEDDRRRSIASRLGRRAVAPLLPVPSICDHISEATRQKLVTDVDRTTDELRLQDFLVRAHDIFREISHQQLLSEIKFGQISLSSIFSRRNQEYATWLAFYTACVINGIMMAYAKHERPENPENPRPFQTKENDLMWVGNRKSVYDFVLTPLNVFNIMLSSFTLLLFLVVRCPVTYASLIEKGKGPAMALLNTMLDAMTLYYFIYTLFAALGLKFRIFSAFLLLDIIVKDPTSQDVINAIVYPRRQLGATALLGFFVVYIFAMIVFQSFSDDFSYTDEGPEGGASPRTAGVCYGASR
ncbi:Inositol 1,4,5-trisphosphate receptor [Aureococcus anophagefferens]|nr:Inositol 1,4,5-trisphosphate receptor [Aureococcus anophagefferens]